MAEVIGSALRYANEKYLLYTATIDDGKLKYSDNTESRYYSWIHANGFFNSGSDKYLVLADLMTSAGYDFMQRVEKAASPTASPINLGWYDEELVYYKLAD